MNYASASHRSLRFRPLSLALVLSLAGASTACTGESSSAPAGADTAVATAKSSLSRDLTPAVDAAAMDSLVDSQNAFAIDMQKKVGQTFAGKNVFLSPHSIASAFTMLYGGASGATKSELAKVLHFTQPDAVLHPAANKLALELESRAAAGGAGADGKGFRFALENSFWAERTTTWEAPYLDLLAVNYGAAVNLVDFKGDADTCRKTINAWTSAKTEQRVNEFLPPGAITERTRFVLANTVYFNAAWLAPFSPTKVSFTSDAGTADAPAIFATGSYRRASATGVEAVAVPYEGGKVEFVAVVPTDLASYEAQLDSASLDALFGKLTAKEVSLTMPKLEIEGDTISLKAELLALGLTNAFSLDADFTAATPDGVYIDDVLHKTFLKLDEKGTEAAGATAIIGVGKGGPTPSETFKIDRPYLLYVRDIPTGAILFAGRITKPESK